MECPIAGSDAHLEETGVFVANLTFDVPEETSFLPTDVKTLELPLPSKPFTLPYPSHLMVTLNSFLDEKLAGSAIFALGDPNNAKSLLTFGFRQDADSVDEAALTVWATRVAQQYKIENPTLFSQPRLETHGRIAALKGGPAIGAYYLFHLENLELHRQNQLRVVVVADGNDRYTLSMLTIRKQFEDINHLLVYAAAVTANDMMVDSLLRRLTGSGF